jgi:hypothetical protein
LSDRVPEWGLGYRASSLLKSGLSSAFSKRLRGYWSDKKIRGAKKIKNKKQKKGEKRVFYVGALFRLVFLYLNVFARTGFNEKKIVFAIITVRSGTSEKSEK